MNHKLIKILNLAFNLYKYWRPSAYSCPYTPTAWKCSIAEISLTGDHLTIDNFVTGIHTKIFHTKDIITSLKYIDSLLNG